MDGTTGGAPGDDDGQSLESDMLNQSDDFREDVPDTTGGGLKYNNRISQKLINGYEIDQNI